MTIVLMLLVVTLAGILLATNARRRAAREAALAEQRVRMTRRPRVPVVSNNVKGVTASQTIQPLRSGHSAASAAHRDRT